ncbi:hypothetical protein FB567DRAFT_491057 [Paraphoma chrysanthemicola]|uniref:Uncharacterized protein n=1 Tax=Paraphoma chrysanthemicola TaxID=798071 RepID=A0A8K0RCX7_9PLEO|nr:hypothetical protein FB567DRAFT_491057 [Paraphoma chrysanthemicola]
MTNTSIHNATWPPANPWALKFTNCDELVQIWSWYQLPDELSRRETKDEIINYSFHGLDNYLRNVSREQHSRPSNEEVLAWIRTPAVEEFITELTVYGSYELDQLTPEYIVQKPSCWLQACRAERWNGNPDIAGVGMLTTYLLQACFVTVYLFALVTIRFDWTPVKMRNSPSIKRTLLAIQHSTGSFLSASFVFSIAMLLASLFAVVDDTSNARYTSWALLLIMPISSILPLVVLQLAESNTLRRTKGRMAVWFLLLMLTLNLLVHTWLPNLGVELNDRFKVRLSDWEARCLEIRHIYPIIFLSWAIAGLVCLSAVIFAISAGVACKRHKTRNLVRVLHLLWWPMIILAFSAMWTFVGWLTYFTFSIRDRARNSNKDAEWSFGQFLALSTWMPFLVEFAYVWCEEPEKALNGRLIAPYEVVKVAEETESTDLEQSGGDEASARLVHRRTI